MSHENTSASSPRRSCSPVPTAVAHPCDSSLSGAVDAAARADRPHPRGPRAKIERSRSSSSSISRAGGVDAPHSHAAAATAVELVREGKAEALMKGSLTPTS
jgi:phosphate acetyltransferase